MRQSPFALFHQPAMVRVSPADSKQDARQVVLDLAAPLVAHIPLLQTVFAMSSIEFSFRAILPHSGTFIIYIPRNFGTPRTLWNVTSYEIRNRDDGGKKRLSNSPRAPCQSPPCPFDPPTPDTPRLHLTLRMPPKGALACAFVIL
jgi:hypothetical protein